MKKVLWMACLAAVAMVLSMSGASAGDETAAAMADKDAMMEAWMKAATPGEPHAQLAEMAGDWTTKTTHYEMGEATESTEGTASFEPMFGGRVVKGTYTGVMWGQPFEGMSLDGYDNVTGKYWSVWLDNMGTQLYVTHGKMKEDGKTMVHKGTMMNPDGSEGAMRFVTTRESDTRTVMEGYMTMPGVEGEMHTMTIEFTRASS